MCSHSFKNSNGTNYLCVALKTDHNGIYQLAEWEKAIDIDLRENQRPTIKKKKKLTDMPKRQCDVNNPLRLSSSQVTQGCVNLT